MFAQVSFVDGLSSSPASLSRFDVQATHLTLTLSLHVYVQMGIGYESGVEYTSVSGGQSGAAGRQSLQRTLGRFGFP
jgi:hypothetical protein